MLTLGLNYVVVSVLVAVFMLVCVAMILIVLIQRPQGGGLSGAFGAGGGDGAGQTAFGTKTGDVLTITTIGIFVLYLLIAIGLNFATRPQGPTNTQPSITAPEGAETEVLEEDAIEPAVDVETVPEGDAAPAQSPEDAGGADAGASPEPSADPADAPTP